MQDRRASVVVPNYNGRELLEKYLPPLISAVKPEEGHNEVIVVDDGSTDNSAVFLGESFPQVRVVGLGANFGFARAVNEGVKAARNEIIVLLNSDVCVKEDFLDRLLPHFDDERVFAVAMKVYLGDRKTFNRGRIVMEFRKGLPCLLSEEEEGESAFSPSIFASGGSGAFDKRKFLKLGGFDELYYPFYFEDLDLCYRAWKMGWVVLYEPKSVVFHELLGTIGKRYDDSFTKLVHQKHRFLFIWRNITDPALVVQHLFFVIPGVIIAPFLGRLNFSRAFFAALKELPKVSVRRCGDKPLFKFTDREVLALVAGGAIPNK